MKASGYNPNVAQWIAAGVSVLFGKKYNESTGKITGNDLGIGLDPATDTVATVGTAPWWAPFATKIVITLGSAAILGTVVPSPGEDGTGGDGTGGGGNGGNDGGNDQGTKSMLLPILLVGGAAAAYFIFAKKK